MSLDNVTKQLESFAYQMDQECRDRERSLQGARDQLKSIEPEIDLIDETICRYELEL